jgi:hypothetical protein
MKKNDSIQDIKVLHEFLEISVGRTDTVFEKFLSLKRTNTIDRGKGSQRFLYIRGERENKVLLVAHADTVWDGKFESKNELQISNGIIRSSNGNHGIGADDRAGCAMVFLLKDLGHSLLIVDGEEQRRLGSKWLMAENIDVANEINNDHNFIVEFDRRNSSDYKCYNVGTDEFRRYIEKVTGYNEPDRESYTDIVTLCTKITGVNLSVGFQHEHFPDEYLKVDDWLGTLNLCRNWLSAKDLPKFLLKKDE